MKPSPLPFGRQGVLLGASLVVAVHLVVAAPVYLGRGVPVSKDLVLQFQPLHSLLARQAWPPYRLWESRGGLGFPLLAESQSSQLYPPSIAARLLLDPDLGIFPLLYLHLPLSGIFMLLLARELRLPLAAACLASLAWMSCGFMVTHLELPPMLFQAAWLPAVAAALAWHFRTGKLLPLAAAAAALGCMLLAGHFQVAFYSLLFLTAWAFFVPQPAQGEVARWKALLGFGVAVTLAVALSFAQLKPTLDFLQHSNRDELGGGLWVSWRPRQVFSLVQPFLFGVTARPALVGHVPEELSTYWGKGVYWETALYVGVLPLLLALLTGRARGRQRFLWAAGALTLVLAAGRYAPGHDLLWRLPLWGSFRFPARLLVLTQFCLALLAGYGAARLSELDAEALRRVRRGIGIGAVAFFLGLGVAWATAGRWAGRGSASAAVTLDPVSGANLRLLALVLLVLFALTVAERSARARLGLPWLFLALTALDLGVYVRAQQLLAPPDFYRRPLASPAGCSSAEPERRYYSIARYHADPLDHQLDLLPASLNLRTPCSAVDYFGSLYDARFSRYVRALLDSYAEPGGRLLETPRRLDLFALGGVHHLLRRQPAVGERLTLVEEAPGGRRSYALAGAAPPVCRSRRARTVRDGEAAWRAVSVPGFDSCRDLVVEGPVDTQDDDGSEALTAAASVRVVARGDDWVELETEGAGTGWLVWSQAWSPRWRARVDGRAAPVRRANYLFLAVAVPSGASRVRLEYSEPALAWGAVTAVLALGLCVVFAWWDSCRRRSTEGGASSGGMGRS